MKRRVVCILAVWLMFAVFCAVVWADDIYPPPWRGEIRTTFQEWTFDDEDNPAYPENIANPYGEAWAAMFVAPPIGAGWIGGILGRTGIWGDMERIDLDVDNVADPYGRKEVWLQVTYYHPPSDIPIVSIPGGVFVSGDTMLLETYGYGSWFVDHQVWEIIPNPSSEEILITADPAWGMTIDQIVVDTACFPEKPVITDVERNASGNIEITWTSRSAYTYSVGVSTSPYDYDEESMAWVRQSSGIPGAAVTTTWEDTLTPSSGKKFYRIYAEGPIDQKADDTVGMMVIDVKQQRNMISSPFEPYPEGGGTPGLSTLDKIVGDQLTGHVAVRSLSDTIEAWDPINQKYMRAWYKTGTGWRDWYITTNPPSFGLDADVGYWFNRVLGHPDTAVKLFGRVSKTDRTVGIQIRRNLVGSCFPVGRTLADAGLVDSGFIGHDAVRSLSDTVEFWNNGSAKYQRFWYRTSDGTWQPWNVGEPMRNIVPGDSIWVNLPLRLTGFTWTYPRP